MLCKFSHAHVAKNLFKTIENLIVYLNTRNNNSPKSVFSTKYTADVLWRMNSPNEVIKLAAY